MRIVSYSLVLILLLILVAFAIINATTVELNYYFGQQSFSLSLLMAYTFAAGVFFGLLFTMSVYLKQKSIQKQLKRQIKSLVSDVEGLTLQPDKDK